MHTWNHICLVGLIALFVVRAVVGNFTTENMIGALLAAAMIWAIGWGVIGTWRAFNRDARPVDRIRPLGGDASNRRKEYREPSPEPQSRPDTPDAPDASETETQLSDWKERYGAAFIAIEYRPDATEAWNELKLLPKRYREKFLEKLSAEPQVDIADIKSIILLEHQKEMTPFDDDQMNEALAEARKLGKMAEKEFLSVHETLGKSVAADHLIEMIREKYQVKKIWGENIIERGLIGSREYYIIESGKVFVEDKLGKIRLFRTIDEARRVFNIPSNE